MTVTTPYNSNSCTLKHRPSNPSCFYTLLPFTALVWWVIVDGSRPDKRCFVATELHPRSNRFSSSPSRWRNHFGYWLNLFFCSKPFQRVFDQKYSSISLYIFNATFEFIFYQDYVFSSNIARCSIYLFILFLFFS